VPMRSYKLDSCHIVTYNPIILDCTCVAVPIFKTDLGLRTTLFRDHSARYCDACQGLTSIAVVCLSSVSVDRELAIAISTGHRFSLQSSGLLSPALFLALMLSDQLGQGYASLTDEYHPRL
jgi:hypothetical protein